MSDIDRKLRELFEKLLSRFEEQLGGKIATLVDYSDEYIVVIMDDPDVVPGRTLKIDKKTKKVSAFIPSENLKEFSEAVRKRSARFTKMRKAPPADDFEDDKNTLAHHGIKGQKWGVRRFQNPDGSLTKAGAERYGKGASGKNKGNEEKQSKPGYEENVAGMIPMAAVAILTTAVAVARMSTIHDYVKMKSERKKAEKKVEEMLEDATENSNLKAWENEREGEKIDPESGLYMKAKKNATDAEDMERINSNVDSDNNLFKVNCTACTVAMELRQRGFDTHAGTDGKEMGTIGGSTHITRQNWYKDGAEYVKRTSQSWCEGGDDGRKKILEMAAQTPNTRGEIAVTWEWGGGHSMYYKSDKKGRLTIFDTQVNKTYSDKDLDELFQGIDGVSMVRLDDLEYDYDELRRQRIIV